MAKAKPKEGCQRRSLRILIPVYATIDWVGDETEAGTNVRELGERIFEEIADNYSYPEKLACGHIRRAPLAKRK